MGVLGEGGGRGAELRVTQSHHMLSYRTVTTARRHAKHHHEPHHAYWTTAMHVHSDSRGRRGGGGVGGGVRRVGGHSAVGGRGLLTSSVISLMYKSFFAFFSLSLSLSETKSYDISDAGALWCPS